MSKPLDEDSGDGNGGGALFFLLGLFIVYLIVKWVITEADRSQ